LSGATVNFLGIAESSNDPLPLFGPPSTSANTLSFRPQNYLSQSKNDVDITDSHLTMTIAAKPGGSLLEVQLQESGDFTLIGLPGAMASASVATPATLTLTTPNGPLHLFANMVFERDTIPASNPPVFGPSSGTFSLPGEATGGTFWRGRLTFANLGQYHATTAFLSLDDVLSTLSAAGTEAKIEKKSFDVTVVVPEPATLALLGVGVLGLAVIGWRKR
jgi:hypothetical protein